MFEHPERGGGIPSLDFLKKLKVMGQTSKPKSN